jgi:phage major head subunit gpT-like protein
MALSDMLPKWLRASGQKCNESAKFTAGVTFSELVAKEGEPAKRPSFSINGYTGSVMNVSGFYNPVVIDLAGLKAARAKLPILLDHDSSQIVGQGEATIDAAGLRISGTVTGDDGPSAKVVSHAKGGFEWQASIGATITRREFLEAGKKAIVNGREVSGPLLIAREAVAQEVSFVAIGADGQTSATVAATLAGETDMNFEQWLAAKGYDPAKIEAGLKVALQAAFDAEVKINAGTTPVTPVAPTQTSTVAPVVINAAVSQPNVVAEMRAEHARLAKIEALCGASHGEIKAKAIDEGWSADAVELEVLRAGRGNGPAIHVTSTQGGPTVIEAALAMAGNLPNVEKQFDDKTLQAAHTQYKGRIGVQQMLLEAAWQAGHTGRHFDKSAAGMGSILRAAFSTYSLSGILSNTANKFLLAGFMTVEDSWKQIASVRSVSDFKTSTSYRMTGASQFDKVGPGGEIKHGTIDEESYTNKAETYGKMFGIPRQDIINDDLGALTQMPQKIGRGGGLKLNDVFWTEFVADHATFFNTDNSKGNYQEGSGTVLGIDSLTAAETIFLDKTDADGKPLGLGAEILLVPNALFTKATTLMAAQEVRDTTASTKYATSNPHAGKFNVVRSSYLGNASYGNSTVGWYLLANPASLSMIEVAFLNGQQNPTVETADADFNTLGIQMRGYFDFGVNKQDYRAAVKSKGSA